MCDQDLDPLVLESPVFGDVLALEMSVDRHLGIAPSADRGDEIQRHNAALAGNDLGGAVANRQVELPTSHEPSLLALATPFDELFTRQQVCRSQ